MLIVYHWQELFGPFTPDPAPGTGGPEQRDRLGTHLVDLLHLLSRLRQSAVVWRQGRRRRWKAAFRTWTPWLPEAPVRPVIQAPEHRSLKTAAAKGRSVPALRRTKPSPDRRRHRRFAEELHRLPAPGVRPPACRCHGTSPPGGSCVCSGVVPRTVPLVGDCDVGLYEHLRQISGSSLHQRLVQRRPHPHLAPSTPCIPVSLRPLT